MLLRRLSLLASGAGLVLATVSCDKLTGNGNGNPVLLVTLNARSKGAGYTTSPVANFYRVSSANFSSATAATDSCRTTSYDPSATGGTVSATSIGGGAYIALKVSGVNDTLRKASTTDLTYKLTAAAGMNFTPGDSMTFVVPGDVAGFPGATFLARTAEPFTVNPIVAPPAGQPMTLSWSAATDADAAMLVSLRYVSGAGTALNAQIFCDFKDDGSASVPSNLITFWTGSPVREVFVQRLRTSLIRITGVNDSYFNMISTFDVPTPVSP